MNTIIKRNKFSRAFLVFSIVYTIGFMLLIYGGGIFESKAAIHISLVLMAVVAPAAAMGSALLQSPLRRHAKQVAVC
ncbi:cell shape-determining protein MreC [Paraburkholderia sp. GAS448]|uniref:hypothetical protein n=1 Tax=Paraburkholderia sp. GAS448 TaxID=3035136 RepID=UPI003D19AE9B